MNANIPSSSISSEMLGYLLPHDGADMVATSDLGDFAKAVETESMGGCLAKYGFPPPGGPVFSSDPYGNPAFPNLAAIESAHNLGAFVYPQVMPSPAAHMGVAEQLAYQADEGRCARAAETSVSSLDSSQVRAIWSSWYDIVYAVMGSPQIDRLEEAGSRCSAQDGVVAANVQGLYTSIERAILPVAMKRQSTAALEAKGAKILVSCFGPAIEETTALLAPRRSAFAAAHALEIDAIENAAAAEIDKIEKREASSPGSA